MKEEIKEAYELVDEKLLAVIKKALVNIRKYHEKQLQNSWFTPEDGIILGQKVTHIAKAGVYVPGGKAVYPSSVLMNVLPAKVAEKNGNAANQGQKYSRIVTRASHRLLKYIKTCCS